MEIISPSDKRSVLAAKIADYRAVDVQEIWLVRAAEHSIELLRLSVDADEIESVGLYERGQIVTSFTFDGLAVAVDDIFAN